MTTRTNPDGTIDVRVVLTLRVDPKSWAEDVMGEHPDDTLQTHVRRDVKRWVRNLVAEHNREYPYSDVTVHGLYE